jgi:hypothetical protein
MKRMYYSDFPAMPKSITDGLMAAWPLYLLDARVGVDNSAFLDIFHDDDWKLTAKNLVDMAEFFGTPPEYVFVESVDEHHVSVTFMVTVFDFSPSFIGSRWEKDLYQETNLPGEEDSNDWIEAQEALDRALKDEMIRGRIISHIRKVNNGT